MNCALYSIATQNMHCRFLDEYDLKVPSGSFKYKKAAEFLMNTIISGIKGIVKDLVGAKDTAAARASAAEASVTQVGVQHARPQRLCQVPGYQQNKVRFGVSALMVVMQTWAVAVCPVARRSDPAAHVVSPCHGGMSCSSRLRLRG